MQHKSLLSRRDMLGTMMAGAAGAALGAYSQNVLAQDAVPAAASASAPAVPLRPCDPRVRGPFPILSTPFTESGDVDYEVLGKAAQFVDWCGSPGMIWPQSGDSVDLLTMDEKLKGMETLANAMRGRKSALCLGVQGSNIEEMLVYAKHAEKLEPTAIISRPPDDGKTEEDMRKYWHALASVVKRPVIIQTTGGTRYKGPAPSVPLLIELGRDLEYFGYVKEEAGNTIQRMRELIAAKPVIKTVFSAMGGFGWLHQSRIGTEGLITERAVYADLLACIWRNMESGNRVAASDAFGRLVLMLNTKETMPGDLRGVHLYIWKKRGIFKNMISRNYGPKGVIPEKPIISELSLSQEQMAELDDRFESLKPCLKEGEFTA